MRPRRVVTWEELYELAHRLAAKIRKDFAPRFDDVYGVPTGGSVIAVLVAPQLGLPLASAVGPRTLVLDDICDSGRTLGRFPGATTAVLHVRPALVVDMAETDPPTIWVEETGDFVVYPYERQNGAGGEEIITRMIERIGDDPNREGLRGTPARVLRAWTELFAGYTMEVPLTTFEDPCDEMVICKGISYYSFCEHHMLPFFGQAHIGYLPDKRLLGLSKLSRLVEKFSRRLQVQEKLTVQIAAAVQEATGARGVAVVVEGQHFCMMSRGVKQQDSTLTTSAMLGRLRESAPTRAEFMALIGK